MAVLDRTRWPCLAALAARPLAGYYWSTGAPVTLLHWRDCITVGAAQDARGLTAAARGDDS
jgi:hypothetical protein